MTRLLNGFYFLGSMILFQSCSDVICAVKGDNVEGRITYTPLITTKADHPDIVIEGSRTADFSAVHYSKIIHDAHNLVTLPYSVCIEANQNTIFRAYQDTNKNGAFDTNEPAGRFDSSDDGRAGYVSKKVTKPDVDEENSEISGIDIALDTEDTSI